MAKRILIVAGARPQFVKAGVLLSAMTTRGSFEPLLVHTGQHYDEGLSEIFFSELELPPPTHHFVVPASPVGAQLASMITQLEAAITSERPDCIVVIGDTNSTLAGAIAANKAQVRLAHVEAGLRSFDRSMPEENNRIIADHLADLLFAPTDAAVQNLHREGLENGVHQVGDVLFDAALHFQEVAMRKTGRFEELELHTEEYVLATVHRAATTDNIDTLTAVFEGLMRVSDQYPVVLPLHPRTKAALKRADLLDSVIKRLTVIEPVGFLDMIKLESHALHIATDSGGVQKEAYFLRKPCSTLRDTTEWVELLDLGWARLTAPTSAEQVATSVLTHIADGPPDSIMADGSLSPYGKGDSAVRMCCLIESMVA